MLRWADVFATGRTWVVTRNVSILSGLKTSNGRRRMTHFWVMSMFVIVLAVAFCWTWSFPSGGSFIHPSSAATRNEDWIGRGRQAFEKRDFASAMTAWRAAADTGNAEAQYWIGFLYFEGNGVPVDSAQALQWFLRSASQGYIAAQNQLGLMFQNGLGTSQDYAQAVDWYRRAADQRDAAALNSVGWLFQEGRGTSRDYVEARRWYRMAADKGFAPSMSNLAGLYQNGKGIRRDFAEALRWYQLAWVRGADKWAAYNISQFYQHGWGVDRDGRGRGLLEDAGQRRQIDVRVSIISALHHHRSKTAPRSVGL